MPCAGNSSEACGGPNLLTTYYANTAAPSGPQTNPGPSGWTSFGCWTDAGTRTLANQVQVDGGAAAMTVAKCTTACGSAGFTLAGLEYASECWHVYPFPLQLSSKARHKCEFLRKLKLHQRKIHALERPQHIWATGDPLLSSHRRSRYYLTHQLTCCQSGATIRCQALHRKRTLLTVIWCAMAILKSSAARAIG